MIVRPRNIAGIPFILFSRESAVILDTKYFSIMGFIEHYHQLKDLFDLNAAKTPIPDSQMSVQNFDFISDGTDLDWQPGKQEYPAITENLAFRYPVIVPSPALKHKKAILFLHGLNERNWYKHLPAARFLAEKTGTPVILFPLSYHINRGLPEWTDTRKMAKPLEIRKLHYTRLHEASVINLALSERLTEKPQRFFNSGYQSALDLIKLKNELHAGHHPLFESGTKTDIFAYSISCLMMQAMMISLRGNLMSDSKIVFFAGGSLFSHMNGTSRYIMDNVAFAAIRNFYLEMISPCFRKWNPRPWLMENRFGQAFTWLIDKGNFDRNRVQSLQLYHPNLMVVALKNDVVIPVEGIRSAFGDMFCRSPQFRIVHFPYHYTHENPFPVLNVNIGHEVDKAFESVFEPVSEFFKNAAIQLPYRSGHRKTDQKAASSAR